jgi:hypothetical protein
MALTKVLITVKTYPTFSSSYGELVCTAGFLQDGTWIRLYPIPFRKLQHDQKYKKYQWIELDIVKNEKDFRPESFRPSTIDTPIKLLDHIDTKNNWFVRKQLVLNTVYSDMKALIAEAQDKEISSSLAVFKPTVIKEFLIKKVDGEYDKKKLDQLRALNDQQNLFEMDELKFELAEKLPYKFSYVFEDQNGVSSTMMIEDWEIGQLFRNTLAASEGNEAVAIEKVREKYFDDFALTKDLYLFLGTTKSFHYRSKNPFMIIGTFTPKIDIQTSLF